MRSSGRRAPPLVAGIRRRSMTARVTTAEVIEIARNALLLAPTAFPADQPVDRFSGQPKWFPFEIRCWELGEQIRRQLVESPRLRDDSRVGGAILEVIEHNHLRRGRQSFVMLLGSVKFASFAPRLVRWVSDPDVAGHVVDTLLKMRASGYVDVVRPYIASEFSWIRRKAKTFVERYAV